MNIYARGKNPTIQCSHTAFLKWLIPSYLFAVLLPKPVHQLSPFISALLVYYPKMIITNDWWRPQDFFKSISSHPSILYNANPIWFPFAREDVGLVSAVLIKSNLVVLVPSLLLRGWSSVIHLSLPACHTILISKREFLERKKYNKGQSLNSSVQQMNSDAEFPELSNVTFLLQACAPKQQLHLGWGSNISFDYDPVDPSATWALSASSPLLATTLEIPLPAV